MGRNTNLALGLLTTAAIFTGLLANAVGVDLAIDPIAVHGAIAVGILLLAPWKSTIIRRGLRRGTPAAASVTLLIVVVAAIGTGLLHSTGLVTRVGPLTLMQVHVGTSLLLLPLLAAHFRRHPLRPRRVDLGRRAAIRALGVSAMSVLLLGGWRGTARAAGWPGEHRRHTGSHERGSYDPSGFPVTSWFDDRTPTIDPASWRLTAGDASYSLSDISAMPSDTIDAVLDCTSAWYSQQRWTGVRLDRLLPAGEWRSLRVRSATGYIRRFPVADLDKLWLATAVGGKPLTPGHGYPARIVAPGRRGFWWVKWVEAIEGSPTPSWLQSPFPLS